jgi:hypothetical protein
LNALSTPLSTVNGKPVLALKMKLFCHPPSTDRSIQWLFFRAGASLMPDLNGDPIFPGLRERNA